MRLRRVLLPLALLSTTACTTVNSGFAALAPNCSQDWYQAGKRDGRLGLQPWDVQYDASCGGRFDRPRYVTGWQAGASDRPAQPGS